MSSHPADAAQELVALLADEGVSHLFMNPGTDTAPVQEALARAREAGTPHPRAVLCVHEHVALSAAIGHHMLSDRPQAVMVHVDAGTLNLGGAIHNAQRNRVPVVVLAGRSPYSVSAEVPGHRDSPIHWQQEQLDQAAGMRAFGKWNLEVPRGRDLGRLVRRAFQVAQSDPKGMAYLMLPREALMEPGGVELPPRLRAPRPPGPDREGLAQIAAGLAGASDPVIVTGRTGAEPACVPMLARIAELLGAPVIDAGDRLNLAREHPMYAGPAGDGFLSRAGAVLLLDSEVPWVPALAEPPRDAPVYQIDIDCAKVTMPSWFFPVEVAVTAATAAALPQLEEELRGLATPARLRAWEKRRARVATEVGELHGDWRRRAASSLAADLPDAVLAQLNLALPPGAIVLEEAVTNRQAALRQLSRPAGQYYQAGSPSLGWAIGAAVGAKLARPDALVVAVCGDGAFHFGVPTAALWTAHRAGAPFVTVVLNNHSYYASKRPVQKLYPGGAAARLDDYPETDLGPDLDYAGLARACGGDGEVVEEPGQLPEAMRRACEVTAGGRCAVLDVRLPRP